MVCICPEAGVGAARARTRLSDAGAGATPPDAMHKIAEQPAPHPCTSTTGGPLPCTTY
jgi:hypothetical protein